MRFSINGHIAVVRQGPRNGYTANYSVEIEGRKLTGYSTSPGCHKAVLLSALDDCGAFLDSETINWPEDAIVEVQAKKGSR